MGQAKKRGTFEQRQAEGIERRKVEEFALNKFRAKNGIIKNTNKQIRSKMGYRWVALLAMASMVGNNKE